MRFQRLAALTAMVAAWSSAATITFTHAGTGSGQIGGTTFTNADFVIVDTADTASRIAIPGGWSINDLSASISIAGLGTFTFLTPTRTFVNNVASFAGFSRSGASGDDLYFDPVNPAFASWDLLSSIGPISGTGQVLQWTSAFAAVNTNRGVLTINSGTNPGVFTAAVSVITATPEPSSLVFLCLGLIGMVVVRLRYSRHLLPRA